MTLELGPGILALIGSVITTLGGLVVLWLTQRAEFRKAAQQREFARLDAVATAAQVAADLANKTDASAAVLKAQVAEDGAKKDIKLDEIHTLVDGRLSKALDEIGELKRIIAGLISAPLDLHAQLKVQAVERIKDEAK